jgi:hypothetical protein
MQTLRIGDRVIFRGRGSELGQYSADLQQLIGREGVVVDPKLDTALIDVWFEGVYWRDNQTGQHHSVFPVLVSEVEVL